MSLSQIIGQMEKEKPSFFTSIKERFLPYVLAGLAVASNLIGCDLTSLGGGDSKNEKKTNRPPILNTLNDMVCYEGDLVKVMPTAEDPDGDTVTYQFSWPLDGNGRWRTRYTDAGLHSAVVTAVDNSGAIDSKTVNMTVNDVPNPPLIAFVSDIDGNNEVYYTLPDGSGTGRVTNNLAQDNNPCWHPDKTKLVFDTNRTGNYEIFCANPDGTGLTNLTNTAGSSANDDEYRPAYSPDGTRILFDTSRGGILNNIFVMNVDGTGQTNVSNSPHYSVRGRWSPDGTKIVYMSNMSGSLDVYMMNVDGSGQTNLTSSSTANDEEPCFTADGTRIVFTSDRDQMGIYNLYLMMVDGSNVMRLTNNSCKDTSPSCSPNGSQIAFMSDRDGSQDIFLMDLSGEDRYKIADTFGTDSQPSFPSK